MRIVAMLYRAVYGDDEAALAALLEGEQLLEQGIRSPDWDLSAHLDRAYQRQHSRLDEIRTFAARIASPEADAA